jgi:hypothetical protein
VSSAAQVLPDEQEGDVGPVTYRSPEFIKENESMNLKLKVTSLQQDTEALLKLLGGNEADRERFWEIIKGITTPAVARLLEHQIDILDHQVKLATQTVQHLENNAKELGARVAAHVG